MKAVDTTLMIIVGVVEYGLKAAIVVNTTSIPMK